MNKQLAKLTDSQLIEFVKLRLKNERCNIKPTKIIIISRRNNEYFSIRYMLSSKEWANETGGIVFHKFFINEFKLLKSFGIEI